MTTPIKTGLLGKGISRSQSKNLHELLGKLYSVPISYQPMDMANRPEPVSVGKELRICRESGYRGINVTHPYKREAFAEVMPSPHLPTGLPSVNTVLFEANRMVGDNTDFSGFCQAFHHQFGINYRPGRVLLFGAGGVGVAIAFALCHLGASQLVIHDINRQSAIHLVDMLPNTTGKVRAAEPDLIAEMQQADGLVNATPIGMFQYPGNPFPDAGMGGQRWAFDAVYTPENTKFLTACRQQSMAVLSGFQLFLHQGLHAFTLFTGVRPDTQQAEKEFLARFPEVLGKQSC